MVDSGLISVVVPIYNAAEFLNDALESLRSQSYPNFEAILVNDGSTDNSEEICRRFCETDTRFRIINQENKGQSVARNTGINAAIGEWITFLDADDCLFPDTLQTMWNLASKNGVRIVSSLYTRDRSLYERAIKKRREAIDVSVKSPCKGTMTESDKAILQGLYQKINLNSAWGKFYHISIFNDIPALRFRRCMYEDLDFCYRAFDRVDKILILDKVLYYYRDNPKSFINTWSDARLDVLDVTDRIVNYMKDRSPELYKAALDRRFSAHFNMLLEMEKFKVDDPEQKTRCLRVIKEQRWNELTDSNVRLKNKLGALISYMGLPAIRLLCKF